MSKIIANSLTTYKLSRKEELSGQILNLDQKQVIQNERAQIAEQMLGLTIDLLNPADFAVQHAFLNGQFSVYTVLLERSDIAEKELYTPDGSPIQNP